MNHRDPAYQLERLRLTKKAANLIADMFTEEAIGPQEAIVGEVLMMMIGGWYGGRRRPPPGDNRELRRQILKGVAEIIDRCDSTETAH
jgi:hypothetical protein